jgi:hypothetical protein
MILAIWGRDPSPPLVAQNAVPPISASWWLRIRLSLALLESWIPRQKLNCRIEASKMPELQTLDMVLEH